MKQCIPTDDDICLLSQVIMSTNQIWDPSIYNHKIPISEHIKYLPTIPAGEIEEMHDIEGNLDMRASFTHKTTTPDDNNILVETIDVDKF